MSNNFPSIGDIRLSPSDKYYENGVAKFDQLLCDGSEVLESEYPEYYTSLEITLTSFDVSDAITGSLRGCFWTGSVYWVCTNDFMVYEITEDGEQLRSIDVSWTTVQYGFPQGVIYVEGVIYTVHGAVSESDSLRAWNPDTGANLGFYDLSGVTTPNDMAYNADTNTVLVVDSDVKRVVEYTLTGSLLNTYEVGQIYGGIVWVSGVSYAIVYREETGDYLVYTLTDNYGIDEVHIEGAVAGSLAYKDDVIIASGTNLMIAGKYQPTLDSGSVQTPYRVIVDLTED